MLVLMNCFSKFVGTLPIKNKTVHEVYEAMKKVFKKQEPNKLLTDQGK